MSYTETMDKPNAAKHRQIAELVSAAVGIEFNLSTTDILSASRGVTHRSFVRQIAMYLTHIIFRLNQTETGRAFARDRSTVAHGLRVIEDARDDPMIEAHIDRLEHVLSEFRDVFLPSHPQ